MMLFEFPLVESVRTWLRLEHVWQRWQHFLAKDDPHDHHVALMTLFECVDIAGRSDLKRDLVAFLQRARARWQEAAAREAEAQRPRRLTVPAKALEIERLLQALADQSGRLDHLLRLHPQLNLIRTRAHVAGGLCAFDLPSYHYWLQQDAERRRADLLRWSESARVMLEAVSEALAQLRRHAKPFSGKAVNGVFQQPLDGQLPWLVQLCIPPDLGVVPKVSANKYQCNVHFYTVPDERSPQEHVAHVDLPVCGALCWG